MRHSLRATFATIAIAMFVSAPTVAASGPGPPHARRLTKVEYIALIGGYEELQSSMLAVLEGLQTPKDMRIDVAVAIAGTPRLTPVGKCGVALTRYRRLLIAYAHAIDRGETYGPPTDLTVSRFEERASVICRPSP